MINEQKAAKQSEQDLSPTPFKQKDDKVIGTGLENSTKKESCMPTTDKCKNCGKSAVHHNAKTKACPFGRKNRVVGYIWYSKTDVFEPRTKAP